MHRAPGAEVIVLQLDRRRQLSYLLLFVASFFGYGLLAATEVIPGWMGVASMLLFGGLAILTTVGVIRNKELGRLSAQGLVLGGQSPIPWSSVSSIAIGVLGPKFLYGRRALRTVEFLPADQAAALRALPRLRRRIASASTRLYGTPLVLVEKTLLMTAEELVTAAQSFAPSLEVDYVRGAKPK